MAKAQQRAVALVAGAVAASGCLVRLAWPGGVLPSGLLTALGTEPADRTLPLVLALAMLGICTWFACLLTLGAAAQLPGWAGRIAGATLRRLAPAVIRRAVEVALGATTVLAVTAGAAQAAGPAQRPPAAGRALAAPAAIGLDRPAAPAAPAVSAPALTLDRPAADPARGLGLVTPVHSRTPVQQGKAATVTVRPGDSLWRIAARSLPRGAGTGAVERAWHRWYETNRSVIGTDPDLLQPGEQLTPPSA